jgi:hypothetical protein
VLPFANMSADKENAAFFGDGMHEGILTDLANIPGSSHSRGAAGPRPMPPRPSTKGAPCRPME